MPTRAPHILGVIPARLNSTRLPGKVLRPINGRPMIAWVYENARRSPLLTDLLVATDSAEVVRACESYSIPVTLTGEHPSGGDRLHEVLTRTAADIYVNIQGDEPTLRPDHIDLLLQPFLDNSGAQVTTLRVAIDPEAASDPNNVKVVCDDKERALYFSRHAIPYDRDGTANVTHYKHIGLYAYTRSALQLFHSLPQSSLEMAEKLEQLRFLQHGVPIHVALTEFDTVGVDTEDDLARAIALLGTTEGNPHPAPLLPAAEALRAGAEAGGV